MKGRHEANHLIHASSPYLLQHAYNPVRWREWGEEVLGMARDEDRPIILSIGYSSCHWCHVMEEEDFENEEIAELMNRAFVPVKVDREERPDIDQLYMEAAQLMGMGGGWPLNVFLTPDARPFFAGTYFPPDRWKALLQNVNRAWQEQRGEIEQSAEHLERSLNVSELQRFGLEESEPEFSTRDLETVYRQLADSFDHQNGGNRGAPKFPLPVMYEFLLRHHRVTGNAGALEHCELTLSKMALGGLHDQVGGGFARYATDEAWFVPHFEKMLYDNAQLVSLYSNAYRISGRTLYREVVEETMAFLRREMSDPDGGFYSALDADSEGVEGRFYVWSHEELAGLFKEDDLTLLCDYYSVTRQGNWEQGNILYRRESDEDFAGRHGLPLEEFRNRVRQWKQTLLEARDERVRPGLDDKILTSWNGLMLKGCADAYRAFHRPEFLDMAVRCGEFLETVMLRPDGRLLHTCRDSHASIPGYLEDYAQVIQGFRHLYEISFDGKWLAHAEALMGYTLENFFDPGEGLFFFTDAHSEPLIARKKELTDNVIPASNSVMAGNLLFMGRHYAREDYRQKARAMLARMSDLLFRHPGFLGNWASLLACLVAPGPEVAIVGEQCRQYREQLEQEFHPGLVFAGTDTGSDLPLLRGRQPEEGRTTVYVCRDGACRLPVHSVEEARREIRALQPA